MLLACMVCLAVGVLFIADFTLLIVLVRSCIGAAYVACFVCGVC